MSVARFFQNKKGEWVLYQHPNLLLWLWLAIQAVNAVVFDWRQQDVSMLADLLLFTWAYLEFRSGASPFRRVLGAIVLTFIVVRLFI